MNYCLDYVKVSKICTPFGKNLKIVHSAYLYQNRIFGTIYINRLVTICLKKITISSKKENEENIKSIDKYIKCLFIYNEYKQQPTVRVLSQEKHKEYG